jgi:hypothetical protein
MRENGAECCQAADTVASSTASRNRTIVFRTITRMSARAASVRIFVNGTTVTWLLLRASTAVAAPTVYLSSMIVVERFPSRRGFSMFSRAVHLYPRHDL